MWDIIENETLPNALMIGVDYDLFWTLNPRSLSPFIKAFSMKQNYDDTLAWQHGLYIKMAIASSFDKSAKYPKKPMMNDNIQKKEPQVMSAEEIKAKMMAQAKIINSRFGKGD